MAALLVAATRVSIASNTPIASSRYDFYSKEQYLHSSFNPLLVSLLVSPTYDCREPLHDLGAVENSSALGGGNACQHLRQMLESLLSALRHFGGIFELTPSLFSSVLSPFDHCRQSLHNLSAVKHGGALGCDNHARQHSLPAIPLPLHSVAYTTKEHKA